MLKHILRSFVTLIFTALFGSIVVFILLRQLGGDVVTVFLGRDAAPVDVSFMREELGLNKPLVMQYLDWLQGIVTGDLGKSYGMGYDIFSEMVRRLGPTLMLTLGGLIVSVPLSLILGTYSAINSKKIRSSFVDVFTQVGIAIPAFWGGLLFVLVFAVTISRPIPGRTKTFSTTTAPAMSCPN